MLVLVNKHLPGEAKRRLLETAEQQVNRVTLLELESGGLVPAEVSGHPVFFFCQLPDLLIVAPDLPPIYIRILREQGVNFIFGNTYAGIKSEKVKKRKSEKEEKRKSEKAGKRKSEKTGTVPYNALATHEYFIHDLRKTDPVILQQVHYLKKIPVKQSFTRSHLVEVKKGHFLTSDRGIEKELRREGLEVCRLSPEAILLPGHANGGIGGACGILGHRVFLNGTLRAHPEGEKVRNYLEDLGLGIIELSETPLTDAGGLFFIG